MAFPDSAYVSLEDAARQFVATVDELLQQGMVERLVICAEVDITRLDLDHAVGAHDPTPALPLVELQPPHLQTIKAVGAATLDSVVYRNAESRLCKTGLRGTTRRFYGASTYTPYKVTARNLYITVTELTRFQRANNINVVAGNARERIAELEHRNAELERLLETRSQRKGGDIKTCLKMALGMAIAKYDHDPYADRNPSTGENRGSIHEDLSHLGLELDSDTIRKHLKEAQDALGVKSATIQEFRKSRGKR